MKLLLFSLLSFITGAASPGAPQGADLMFVGDAMQHQAQLDAAKTAAGGKGYDYSDCFTYIAPEITAADYAVCNLEVPLGGGPDYTGYPCFSAPDSYAVALKDAGFDMFLTANNHCLDRSDRAARRTDFRRKIPSGLHTVCHRRTLPHVRRGYRLGTGQPYCLWSCRRQAWLPHIHIEIALSSPSRDYRRSAG